MTEAESINSVRNTLHVVRMRGELIGLVPTMGALHDGHVQLIRQMKEQAPYVVVSVFVNPTQFGPKEDFASYPRNRENDLEICKNEGVDLFFSPETDEMYPVKEAIRFQIDGLADHLCGKSRPGHFNGVLQVVNKLFNIVQPDIAIFGQKDIQQFVLISRMVQDFNHPVRLLIGETIRESDGLAMSSRNVYLNKKERKRSHLLYKALESVRQSLTENPENLVDIVTSEQLRNLQENGFKTDYLSVVNYSELQPVARIEPGEKYIIAGAVINGKTRLIDNIITDF